jgi:TetR/AcrR family transcriptional regulator, transcriptional repressor for nem operon
MRVLSVTQLPFCRPAPRRGRCLADTPKASGFFNTRESALTSETTGHIVISMARANVRERLVTAGLDTLYRRGFNGCGVEDITRAAGVPKGSFYNYFESKEALGIEVLERFWQSGGPRLKILRDHTLPPVERLRRYFDSLADVLADWDHQTGCMIGNFSTELSNQSQAIRERLSLILAEWTRAIEACVREAQKARQTRTDLDPATIATFLINAWEGTCSRTKVDKDRKAVEHFREIIFTTLFR